MLAGEGETSSYVLLGCVLFTLGTRAFIKHKNIGQSCGTQFCPILVEFHDFLKLLGFLQAVSLFKPFVTENLTIS